MEIEITENDLKEIENKYEDLTSWLTSNLTSFSSCAFVLQSVMSSVDEAKEFLKEDK